MWNDHGKIEVLVAGIYDPAFYFTQEELAAKSIYLDVTAIVELPQVHTISRCGSSDAEQFLLNEFRTECVYFTYLNRLALNQGEQLMTLFVFLLVMDQRNNLRLIKSGGAGVGGWQTTHV